MLDSALCASAFLMGLAGGPHCVAMCGAAQAGVSAAGGARSMVALQLGRLAGYTASGALVATSVSVLAGWGAAAPVLRPLWHLLNVAAIALGAWLLWHGRAPDGLARLGRRGVRAAGAEHALRFYARMPAPLAAAGAGACWAAMPCGLLQSALLVAALASGPAWGAGVMAVFALGTITSLAAAALIWAPLAAQRAALVRPTLALRLAGAMLIAGSGVALVHGLASDIDGALCSPRVGSQDAQARP